MPYRQTPWGAGNEDIRSAYGGDIDIPTAPDMTFLRPPLTVDGRLLLDLPNLLGMMNRRGWGYGRDVKYATSENTETPNEVQILTRI